MTAPDCLTFALSYLDLDDSKNGGARTITLRYNGTESLSPNNYQFVQTKTAVKNLIAIYPYGALIVPKDKGTVSLPLEVNLNGTSYTSTGSEINTWKVGDTITLKKAESMILNKKSK